MLDAIKIKNFKSIRDLELPLGRITVLIGENGCGKSNILEAMAVASAAVADKLDHEFLASRGIRAVEPGAMKGRFEEGQGEEPIGLELEWGEMWLRTELESTHESYPKLRRGEETVSVLSDLKEAFGGKLPGKFDPAGEPWGVLALFGVGLKSGWDEIDPSNEISGEARTSIRNRLVHEGFRFGLARKLYLEDWSLSPHLSRFLIYSPENSALLRFESEGQVLPLGIRGEGLFRLVKTMASQDGGEPFRKVRDRLEVLDWFDDLVPPEQDAFGETTLRIRDRYLAEDLATISQRSANEGFLLLLFYFCLLISDQTPPFFAVDNIDASLNPKLCEELMRQVVELAEAHDKQVVVTTHNPAILDGLNLHDDAQRLYVVRRNKQGHTGVRRVEPPKPLPGQDPLRLSEAFLRGYLGGLPKGF